MSRISGLPRKWSLLAFALLIAAGEAPGQGASGTGTLQSRIVLDPDSEPITKTFTSLENTTSDSIDNSVQRGSIFAQSLASLSIVFQEVPTVDVQTAATQENAISTTSLFVTASASGVLRFQSKVIFKQAPPFFSPTYPVIFTAPYAMTDFGTSNSSASVSVRVYDSDGVNVFDQTATLGVDPPEGQFIITGPLAPSDPVEIWLEANAFSDASNLLAPATPRYSEAQAIIGAGTFTIPPPVRQKGLPGDGPSSLFAFDQAAFDAIHGENSYPLADYLDFELSPNLFNPPDLSDLDLTVARQDDQLLVTFNPVAGFDHTVEVTGSLEDGTWTDLPGAPHNSGAVAETVAPAVTKRFYRVRLVPE